MCMCVIIIESVDSAIILLPENSLYVILRLFLEKRNNVRQSKIFLNRVGVFLCILIFFSIS